MVRRGSADLGEGIVALAWITGRNSTLVCTSGREPTASNEHDGPLRKVTSDPCGGGPTGAQSADF
jgi:hypothetical protein